MSIGTDLKKANEELSDMTAQNEKNLTSIETLSGDLTEMTAKHEKAVADMAAAVEAHAEAIEAKDTEITELTAKVDEGTIALKAAEDKLKLAPFVDVADGQEPVADGGAAGTGAAGKEVDHLAAMKGMDPKTKAIYYQDNKEEIDALYE